MNGLLSVDRIIPNGLAQSVISISIMRLLVGKRKVGRAIDSAPILADVNCTMVCAYISIGLIYFSYNEGKDGRLLRR